MEIPATLPLPANSVWEEHHYVQSYPCPCEATGHKVMEERLVASPEGKLLDVIKGQCRGCGSMQEFRFEPKYGLEDCIPEVPSQLFDVAEWFLWLMYWLRDLPEVLEREEDLNPTLNALHAAEQTLLFFNPGEWMPRADAFFHSAYLPEEDRLFLTRSRLEVVRDRLGDCLLEFWESPVANDGKLYHYQCLPRDAKEPVTCLDATMVAPEATCVKCGGGFSDPR
ncbi:MAG TPA: hypothetical protein VH866_07895 [Candidatus Deferrimicrobiaceae bacterium]